MQKVGFKFLRNRFIASYLLHTHFLANKLPLCWDVKYWILKPGGLCVNEQKKEVLTQKYN